MADEANGLATSPSFTTRQALTADRAPTAIGGRDAADSLHREWVEREESPEPLALVRRAAQGRWWMAALGQQNLEASVAALTQELDALKRALHQPPPRPNSVRRILRIPGRIARSWYRDGTWIVLRKACHKVALRLPIFLRERVAARWPRLLTEPTGPSAEVITGPSPSASFRIPTPVDPYEAWLINNRWNERAALTARRILASLRHRPLISVIMPVYNVDERWIEKAVRSVRAQVYPDWELCVVDDASTNPKVAPCLERLAAQERRMKVRFLKDNLHISRATNLAAQMAEGEYLLFLDHDDELAPDCLLEFARVADDETDLLYSDNDKIDPSGRRYDPEFKPDWSPELLLSYMYFTHALCVRRELFMRVGGFRAGFEGCQDYDFALRASEHARRVAHIPKVLYHWRCLPTSTASTGAAKPEAFQRAARAIQEALQRRGVRGQVSRPDWAVAGHVGIFQVDYPDEGPSVSILIPTRNGLDLLRRCIDSVLNKTTYRNYEIVIIDNGSDDPAMLKFLQTLPERCRVLAEPRQEGRFNFARINNRAAAEVSGEYLLFLNNDTEVREPNWLSQLVGHAQLPGAGAVGARLLYPGRRVQHAGVIMGLHHGLAGHAFKLLPEENKGYLSHACLTRNYSAVTAACMLVRRDLFLEMGGFDESQFAVAYNDVDFCLRLADRGRRSVYAPRAELIHHEGKTRGFVDNPHEALALRRRWGRRPDPYYNPNLSLSDERFAISPRRATAEIAAADLPIRVLLISHNLNLEGAPLFLYELALGLKRRGRIMPEVFSPHDGPLGDLYRLANIPVHALMPPNVAAGTPEQFDAGARTFAIWMLDMGFQAVHANTLNTFYALCAARQARLPAIWSVHESVDWKTYFDQFGAAMAPAALQAFASAYQVVFASDATRALFEPLNTQHNFAVQHYGLKRDALERIMATMSPAEAKAAIGCPPHQKAVTIVGTTCERKGQHDFVNAAVRLLQSGRRDTEFYVVGCRPSPYLDGLKAAAAGRANRIHFIEETDAVHTYFRASDIFVCCSYNESFPRVILEAMAFRLPIVTTPVFGIAEQVRHEASGLIFSPGDAPGLASHVARLLDDPEARHRLGAGARAAFETIASFDEMAENYERLLLEGFAASEKCMMLSAARQPEEPIQAA